MISAPSVVGAATVTVFGQGIARVGWTPPPPDLPLLLTNLTVNDDFPLLKRFAATPNFHGFGKVPAKSWNRKKASWLAAVLHERPPRTLSWYFPARRDRRPIRSLCSTVKLPGHTPRGDGLGGSGEPIEIDWPVALFTKLAFAAFTVQPPGSTPSKSSRKRVNSSEAVAQLSPTGVR